MKIRLKKHRSGAQYILHPEDLLIVQCFPITLQVHRVVGIISKDGMLELADWITGVDPGYSHQWLTVASGEMARITSALQKLETSMQGIEFNPDRDDYDPFKYEKPYRIGLRFHGANSEIGASLPRREFYLDFDIPDTVRQQYEDQFEKVLQILPPELRTSGEIP